MCIRDRPNAPAQEYLIQSVHTGTLGWSIVLLTPTRQEHQNALLAGVAAGFALALLFATLIFFRLSIKRYNERRVAEMRMQQEYRDLENLIAERTTDLLAANVSLEDKIDSLKSTESILRETRDSAVQAGKLAVLGQMAAGISHEVNQPLTALHTYTAVSYTHLETSLFLSLLLTMLVCLVLGMGIPTIPNYIITSSIAAPALLKLGVPLIVSHMFVFYFGIMADLTPPVALAAFAAASIAKVPAMKIGFKATQIAIAGFVIPFMAVYDPALMMQGDPTVIAVVYIVFLSLIHI